MRRLSGRGAAVGALLLASASSLTMPSVALAQAQQAHAQRAFDIPAQPLTQALTVFARQTGLKLAYPASLTSGKPAPALRGSYAVDEALDRLLAGSGLTYRFTGAAAATIIDPASLGARAQVPGGAIPLDPINVEGEGQGQQGYVATRSTAGSKTDTPIIEVPQTINVVPRRQIVEQGAQSVGEALRYVPGVTTEPNGDTSRYDETRIRGFEPIQYLDGLRLPAYQFFGAPRVEVYGLERIEVLKGPGSALYGQSGPGGLLDMISKRPTDVPIHEVVLQGGSFDRKQAAFDFGGPLNADRTVLYRLTGVIRDGKTVVDFSKDDRYYLAPALTFRPTMDTTFTVLASLTRDNGTFPQNFLPAQGTLQFNPNGTIPASRFWGEPGTDRFRRDSAAIGYLFEHRFNDVFTVRQNLRYARTEVDFLSYYTFGLQGDLRTLDRGLSGQRVTSNAFTVDNQVQADFNTGDLRHKLLVGLDHQNTIGTYRHDFGCCDTIDVFSPAYGQPALPLTIPRNDTRQTQSQTGIYAQDQIKFQQWVLTLGGRHDQVSTGTQDFLAGTTGNQDDRAFTGRAGLTYLFQNGVASYVSYATSFQPTLGIDRLGAPFRPTTGDQLEGGIKYQPPGTNALFTVAAFELRQQNALSPDPVDPTFNLQTAAVRVRGVEFEAKAQVNRNLDVIASYAYLDARIAESSDPTEIGHRVPLTYEHQASLWGLYTFRSGPLSGLGLGAGLRYRGDSFSSNANDILVPSYVLVDGVVSYDFAALDPSLKGARLAINATNLFDRQHVVYCFGQPYCSYGAGRTVLATLSYRW